MRMTTNTKKKMDGTGDSSEADAAAGAMMKEQDRGANSAADNNKAHHSETKPTKRTKPPLTKRAKRRQGPNPKNTWPQQPKIQSAEARTKAYLRVAGFQQQEAQQLPPLDPTIDLYSPEMRFGRLLGSTDQRVRHKAVRQLKAYLRAKCTPPSEDEQQQGSIGISELDLLKLWKGMWYTLYMADKVPVQEQVAQLLADLLWCFAGTEEEDEYAAQAYMAMMEGVADDDEEEDDEDFVMEVVSNTLNDEDGDEDDGEDDEVEEDEQQGRERAEDEEFEEDDDDDEVEDWDVRHCRGAHLASLFLKTFLVTIRREWGNMDKYRVDKFYTLTRLLIRQLFFYMAKRHWNIGIIRLFTDVLYEQVLSQTMEAKGLCLHLMDITLEELAKVNSDDESAPLKLTETTFLDVLEPYFALVQTADDTTVQERMIEQIFEKFLLQYSVISDAAIQDDDEEDEELKEKRRLILDQVHVRSVADFIFHLASDPDTQDRCRESLYTLYKTFCKRLKKIGREVEVDDSEQNMLLEQGDEGDYEVDEEGVTDEQKRHTDDEDEAVKKAASVQDSKDDDDSSSISDDKKSKKKKKKKKSKRKRASSEDENEIKEESIQEMSAPKPEEDGDPEVPLKKRKMLKKGNDKGDEIGESNQGRTDQREEETITISLEDQKRAAEAEKTKKKKKKKKKEKTGNTSDTESEASSSKVPRSKTTSDQDDDCKDKRGSGGTASSSSKKVKFGSSNMMKSHKASMRDLKRAEPLIKTVSPDMSILKSKLDSSVANKSKGKQKQKRKGGRKKVQAGRMW